MNAPEAFNHPIYGCSKGPWIRTFAWIPRWTYDVGYVWMVRVWKRRVSGLGTDSWWQYKGVPPS